MSGKTKLNIVTDGLSSYFDVGSRFSHVGGEVKGAQYIGMYNINKKTTSNTRAEFLSNDSIKSYPTYLNQNGGIYQFNGSTDGLNILPAEVYEVNPQNGFTFSIWLKIVTPSLTGYQILSTLNDVWGTAIVANVLNELNVVTYYNIPGTSDDVQSPYKIQLNEWFNLAYVASTPLSKSYVYINGNESNAIYPDDYTITPTYIGVNTFETKWFNGYMSNVMFYDRALEQSEVIQNYNALKYRFL